MSTLDTAALLTQMIAAAERVLEQQWPVAQSIRDGEFRNLVEALRTIDDEVKAGRMTKERAKEHAGMAEIAMHAVLAGIQGISKVAAQNLINAVLGAIRDTVNTAIGFALIGTGVPVLGVKVADGARFVTEAQGGPKPKRRPPGKTQRGGR